MTTGGGKEERIAFGQCVFLICIVMMFLNRFVLAELCTALCASVVDGGAEWYIMDVWWEIVVNYENSLTVIEFHN